MRNPTSITLPVLAMGLIVAAGLAGRPARAASLADLGYIDGIALRGSSAAAEVFFPLPAGARSSVLTLEVTPSSSLDALSSLTVFVAGEPVMTVPSSNGTRPIAIALPDRLVRGNFIGVRVVADQALRRGEACFDNDTAAVWSRIEPSTRLESVAGAAASVGSAWQNLAGSVSLALPPSAGLPDIEAALVLAVALTERGADPAILNADDAAAGAAQIAITRGPVPLSVLPRSGTTAQLLVAGPGAARALVAAAPLLVGMMGAQVSADRITQAAPARADSISLAELGIHPAILSISGSASLTFGLRFDRLPADKHPTGLVLFGRGATLPADETLIASVLVGDQLAWSRTFRGAVELDGETVTIPSSQLRNRLPITLQLVRAGGKHACGSNDSLGFQLRDTTRIDLAAGYGPVRSFGSFVVPRDRAALVRLDTPAAAARVLPLLARVLADAGALPAAIEIAPAGTALNRPFVVVAETPPPEIAGSAPVRPDLGNVVLQRPAEGVRVELSRANALNVLQVVRTPDGIPGLWISPGSAPVPARPASLSAGNVAVFASAAIPASFDTQSPDVLVESPRAGTLNSLLARWRTELFVLVWIVLTVVVVAVMVRLRRPGRGA